MTFSIPSTTCSTPNNDSVERVVKNDAVRYKKKGYGLLFAILITFNFFYFMPLILKEIWPNLQNKQEANRFYFCTAIGIHSGVYILANIIMFVIYKIKLPFFERYRIITNKPWPWEENPQKWKQILAKTIKNSLIAHFIIVPSFLYLDILKGYKFRVDIESFPTHSEIIGQIFLFMIIEDFAFYWSHRFLHWKRVYPYIHKIHHEYSNAISISAEYSHPLEFIISNLIPSSLGAKIIGVKLHFATAIIWYIIRLMETVDGHSGYEFSWSPYRLLPLSGSSIYHNFHHSHNVGNYSSFFTYLDTLCGTNKAYYRYLAKKDKERILAEMRDEYGKLKTKIENDPLQKIAKLNELNPEFNSIPTSMSITAASKAIDQRMMMIINTR